ncbi:trypsin-like serine protease [Furfurilactobacillus milii]|uniref:trypsin-like serine protease n=1 Tax=Furfurilactobacillus milii TaxID=2888272 RepID=UPI001EEEE73E|nr:trypsin-like serine protease [Furfurilactobacillus milii]MCF6420559.1 trypsin-like serine protease [Furfurilactobacillus milii]
MYIKKTILGLAVLLSVNVGSVSSAHAMTVVGHDNNKFTVSDSNQRYPGDSSAPLQSTQGSNGSGMQNPQTNNFPPISEVPNSGLNAVIGNDDRKVVSDTTVSPYRKIVLLRMDYGGTNYYQGTGVMVSPDTVLTAGHCVYGSDGPIKGKMPDSITVIPANNGTVMPYGFSSTSTYYVSQDYINSVNTGNTNGDPTLDIGVIKLHSTVGNQTGFMGMSPNSATIGEAATISGYPVDALGQQNSPTKQYSASGNIVGIHGNNIFYNIDMTGGDSGSPVYNKAEQIIGINTRDTGATSTFNWGTNLTDAYFNMTNQIIKNSTVSNGWLLNEGKWYFYNDKGQLNNGFLKNNGYVYYTDVHGVMQTGWQVIDGHYYYFNQDGHLLVGWQLINNNWFYMTTDGIMQTGWQAIDNGWFYFDNNGFMQKGWQLINNNWFYLNQNGRMQTGWQAIDNGWFYFDQNGFMQKGWQSINGKWYYLNQNGRMQTGWQQINGQWYYLNADGSMATSGVIDGWSIAGSGVATKQ